LGERQLFELSVAVHGSKNLCDFNVHMAVSKLMLFNFISMT
jgi:hypothetical protein